MNCLASLFVAAAINTPLVLPMPSVSSAPFPPQPTIVSVYEACPDAKAAHLRGSPTCLKNGRFKVTVRGINCKDKLKVYLDRKLIRSLCKEENEKEYDKQEKDEKEKNNLRTVTVCCDPKQFPGIHRLTVRIIHDKFASVPSRPVWVMFEPEAATTPSGPILSALGDFSLSYHYSQKTKFGIFGIAAKNVRFAIEYKAKHEQADTKEEDKRCPGLCLKNLQAHPTLPSVSPVPDNAAGDSCQEKEKDCHDKCNRYVFDYRFPGPAHFAYPRFGSLGETIKEEGVLIYEGMQFLAYPDGHYVVRFTALSPAMPVTLRLQLRVATAVGGPFKLTLPPIKIVPENKAIEMQYQQGNCLHRNYHIYHKGYSPVIAERFPYLSGVTRDGAAKFGSLPTAASY